MYINRRRMLGAGTVALAGLALPGAIAAQDAPAGDLIAGGGAIETPLGAVDFGLVARAGADGKVTGALTLRDMTHPGNPTVLRATRFNRLEPLSNDSDTGRQLIGWASADGQTSLFLLRVEDLDGPGGGKDTVNLVVGGAAAPFLEGEEKSACDCANYSYSVKGTVVSGDILIVAGE
jgi:hypothetical protein